MFQGTMSEYFEKDLKSFIGVILNKWKLTDFNEDDDSVANNDEKVKQLYICKYSLQ